MVFHGISNFFGANTSALLLSFICSVPLFTSCSPDGDGTLMPAGANGEAAERNPKLADPAQRAVLAAGAWAKLDEIYPGIRVSVQKLENLQIRDVCILPNNDGLYYLTAYGMAQGPDGRMQRGFITYASEDLEHWKGPYPAFLPKPDFWKTNDFWAPELHQWRGKYYLFGTTGDKSHRGTSIFVSTSGNPAGPYEPVTPRPVTPEDWMCLDGTLFVDDDGAPWMVFCHEWVQITDGTVCAARLSDDFTKLIGEPVLLFRGSDSPNAHPDPGQTNYVTDGPYLFREDGKLKMIWSGFDNGSYNLWQTVSESGKLTGPWKQNPTPIYTKDGGHGMHFVTFEGKHKFVLHAPNRNSRAVLLDCPGKD